MSRCAVAIVVLLGLGSGLFAAGASAQMPFTKTDRPGVATPPETIPKETIQLEGGIEYREGTNDNDEPKTDTLEFPDMLVRFGVLDRFELRIEFDGLLYQFRERAPNRARASDLTLGAKLRLLEQRRFLPITSLLFELSLPIGSRAVTSDGVDPTFAGLYQWNLDEQTAVVLNTGFAAPTQGRRDDRRVFQFAPRIAFERSLTENIGAYIEYFGEINTGGVADEHLVDGGFSLRVIKRRLQLDISAGGGLNDAAADWVFSAGLSARFRAFWAR